MGHFRTIAVPEINQPADTPATISVEILSETITEESTARVDIELEWDGDTTQLQFNNTVPLELPKRCHQPDSGLLLLPSNHTFERNDDEPECWRPDLPESEDFGHALGLQSKAVQHGDTLSCQAEIWGDHWSKKCLSPGQYSFQETLSPKTDDFDSWGFTLQLKK